MHSPMKRRHYLKFAGSFCSPRHGRQTQLLIRSLKSHGNYLDFHEFLLLWILSDCDISSHLTLNFQEKYIFCINKIFSGTGQGTKTDEFSEKFQTAFDPPPLIFGKSYCKFHFDFMLKKSCLKVLKMTPPPDPALKLFRKFIRFGDATFFTWSLPSTRVFYAV